MSDDINDRVSDRFREERERRGWTYREMSERMSAAGCAMAPSTLQRIEKGSSPGKPRPKIGVAELVAACQVFGLTPEQMLHGQSASVESPTPQEVMSELDGRLFVRVADVARILDVDPRTVRRGIEEGSIPAVRIGDTVRIPVGRLREALGLMET